MIHSAARDGYRLRAATYQAIRPSYHPLLIERFAARYGQGVVVELGAGTGIFTSQLVDAGVDPIAIEPVREMRAVLSNALPGTDARDGTAEAMPVESDSADTVVVAQAFHWLDHHRALAEIRRVLRLGGHLVTVWNVRAEETDWVSAYTEVMDRHAGDTPRYRTMVWRDAIEADDQFEAVDEWQIDNPKATTPEGVIERALSTSFVAALAPEPQQQVADEIRSIVEPLGSEFDFPYTSELQAWRATGPPQPA